MPKATLEAFEKERRNIVATADALRRDLSPGERKRLMDLFDEKIEQYLDAGSGGCELAKPAVAQMMAGTLDHFDGIRYRLSAWCLMPNHVHVVFQPLADHRLADILHAWKSYSANEANRILRRSATFWQREYYDHLVRDENDFYRVVQYVLDNPKKAKLKAWPWVGARGLL